MLIGVENLFGLFSLLILLQKFSFPEKFAIYDAEPSLAHQANIIGQVLAAQVEKNVFEKVVGQLGINVQ
jgi:hypothetical protein